MLVGLSVGLFVGTVIGAVLSLGIPGIGFVFSAMGGCWTILGGVLALALQGLTGFGSYTLAFGAIGFGLGAILGAGHILGPGLAAPTSPLKTLVYSLFFVGVVSLFQVEAALSFVEAINANGPRLLVFVAYNVFADGVSLLETRWILRRGMDAGTAKLLALLVLDLVLSAAIFLFLPMVLWDIPSFLEAALFRGDRPWLGILFWSTFSTSATFYVFVLSSLLIRPLAHVPKVGRFLAIDAQPVLILTIAVGTAVTLTYVVGAGVAAALDLVR